LMHSAAKGPAVANVTALARFAGSDFPVPAIMPAEQAIDFFFFFIRGAGGAKRRKAEKDLCVRALEAVGVAWMY